MMVMKKKKEDKSIRDKIYIEEIIEKKEDLKVEMIDKARIVSACYDYHDYP